MPVSGIFLTIEYLTMTVGSVGKSRAKSPFIAHQIILKVASRCNLLCDYCHWFRDPEVYNLPKLMSDEVVTAFLQRLRTYITQGNESDLSLVFHGGEPILWPQEKYRCFTKSIREIEREVGKPIRLAMQTNGALIDQSWARLLHELRITVSVSIDGPKRIHDAHRVDLNGRGTHEKVVQGIKNLRDAGFDPHVLTVCNPETPPEELCDFFVNELKVSTFDVLTPNFTVDDGKNGKVTSIANYYIRLFDLWYDMYSKRGVNIRILRALVKSALGAHSGMQGIGQNATLATVEILPDGSIEPHDVLRIGGNHLVRTKCNVFSNDLTDVMSEPTWLSAFDAANNPSAECLSCNYLYACGGGDVMHRYSTQNGYDNPSVYCSDMKRIIEHVWSRISVDLMEDEPRERKELA